MNEYTFIIKTFERPYCVKRLVRSLRRHYHDIPIIIGDDSLKSCKDYFKLYAWLMRMDISVVELPFDCGLSMGRNELVKRVTTDYFVLLDDDFVLDKLCDIPLAIKKMKELDIDILGGYFRNYEMVNGIRDIPKALLQSVRRDEKKENYCGKIDFNEKSRVITLNIDGENCEGFCKADIVENFFVAKTDVIIHDCRWDNELKLNEHIAFFFDAKEKGLNVAFSDLLSVMHKPIRLRRYVSYRSTRYFQKLMQSREIYEMAWNYSHGRKIRKYNIEHYCNGRKKLLFGAGKNCKEIVTWGDFDWEGIVDNNKNKRGDSIGGITIMLPDDVVTWEEIFIVITVTNSSEIEKQLNGYGLAHISDYVLYDEI